MMKDKADSIMNSSEYKKDAETVKPENVTVVNVTVDKDDTLEDIINKISKGVIDGINNKTVETVENKDDADKNYQNFDFSGIVEKFMKSIKNTVDDYFDEIPSDHTDGEMPDDEFEDNSIEEYLKEMDVDVCDCLEESQPEKSVADILRDEMENAKDYNDILVDRIVQYVYECVNNKSEKKYKFHKKTNNSDASVEVVVPTDIVNPYTKMNKYISDAVKTQLIELTKVDDVIFATCVETSQLEVFLILK